MKFTTVFALLGASAALAAPTTETTDPPSSCNNNQKQVCCSGLLTCLVQVLGTSCSGEAYCCNTEAPEGTLINIALLTCVDIL